MNGKIAINIEELEKSYMDIEKLVKFIDDKLSVFMFYVTVYISNNMYISISLILHSNAAISRAFVSHIMNSSMCFIATTACATLVSEASEEVGTKAREISQKHRHGCSCLNKTIYLTLWKIIPIRRSFIIGTLGTIFTYANLFNAFE
ncbi:hypothetical protein NPIL_440491 [Nephila pilipes]|uniref:Uncharacterized protein n=1 Tax=Nephila pilipes TaxID=299642 RepID=A0A8X6P758_NEPPI|nr:hypothetical protein NPIL_440491 [Nephila pilipes]